MAITSTVSRRLILRLASEEEYANLGIRSDLVDGDEPAGRAVDGDSTVQLAMLGSDPTTAGQSATLRRLGATLSSHDVQPGPTVRILEAEIPRSALDRSDDGRLPTEMTAALDTFLLPGDEDLLVVGPDRSGKTTALATLAMAARDNGATMLVLTPDRPLPLLPPDITQHHGADAAVVALEGLEKGSGPVLVLVGDVNGLLDTPAEAALKTAMALVEATGPGVEHRQRLRREAVVHAGVGVGIGIGIGGRGRGPRPPPHVRRVDGGGQSWRQRGPGPVPWRLGSRGGGGQVEGVGRRGRSPSEPHGGQQQVDDRVEVVGHRDRSSGTQVIDVG